MGDAMVRNFVGGNEKPLSDLPAEAVQPKGAVLLVTIGPTGLEIKLGMRLGPPVTPLAYCVASAGLRRARPPDCLRELGRLVWWLCSTPFPSFGRPVCPQGGGRPAQVL
jgi:hypothetical protein